MLRLAATGAVYAARENAAEDLFMSFFAESYNTVAISAEHPHTLLYKAATIDFDIRRQKPRRPQSGYSRYITSILDSSLIQPLGLIIFNIKIYHNS